MRVVMDCNVVIAAGLTDGTCRRVVKEVLAAHAHFISDDIVREYRDVISRPKFKRYHIELKHLLEVICEASNWYDGEPPLSKYELPDESDKIYLDLTLAVKANVLITGNKKDFPAHHYGTVKVLSPGEWLTLN